MKRDGTLADARSSILLDVGATLAGRYELVARLGAGGMGVVYRARDLIRDEVVAIKLVHAGLEGAKVRARFERERIALAALDHPGIVRYHDHGAIAEHTTYLAMELIEGEDLGQRLARDRICVEEILALADRLAHALAAAHDARIIHRDLKPSNIVLPAGRLADAKLLDFGVARLSDATGLTGIGHVLGTPGYMSPEQARGDADVDGRTDIYSLGCVLFECLTGEPPFPGVHAMAVLAKILLEDTPRVAQRLATLEPQVSVSPRLDALVFSMMARDRERRPATPRELLALLAALEIDRPDTPGNARATPTLSHDERRVITVLFASRPVDAPATVHGSNPLVEVARASREIGAEPIELVDGSVLISFPTDQVALAARCALTIRNRQPRASIVLASGQGMLSKRSLMGEVIDRGAEIMPHAREGEIRLDEPSAALLESICLVDYDDEGAHLQGMRSSDEPLRTLLGRPTPFVGRARERAALEGILDESLTEPCANAVIVLGEPGVGKSRLRHEFVRRASARWPEVDILIGRADAVGSDAAYGLLARALREIAGIHRGEAPERHADQFNDFLFADSELPASSRRRISAFLGELVGVAHEAGLPALESARADPQSMREAIASAWEEWLGDRCRRRGMLLVLEDLHWGDLGTVELVGRALAVHGELPFIVLALARPELDQRFSGLWAEFDPHRINLELLPRRAARKLAARVLGDVDPSMIDAAVERASGNAFYLEELLRAAVQGEHERLPETVAGMVQSRLAQLDPHARRLLRACAVFGEICWSTGIAHLLGEPESTIAKRLDELCADEFFSRRSRSTIPGSLEYAFRHALVRDATYATLTPDDLRVAHGLAGDWLRGAGATEPAVLARHFLLGDQPNVALVWFEKAAVAALDAEDHARASSLAQAGIDCHAEGEVLGRLQSILARIDEEAGEHNDAFERARGALTKIRAGSIAWYGTLAVIIQALGCSSRFDEIEPWLAKSMQTQPERDAIDACIQVGALGAVHLSKAGYLAAARDQAERVRALVQRIVPSQIARLQLLKIDVEIADMAGDLGAMVVLLDEMAPLIDLIDSPAMRAAHGSSVGHVFAQLGANELAGAGFELDRVYAAPRGLRHRQHAALGMQAFLAYREADLDRAAELLLRARAIETVNQRFIGVLNGLATELALARGDLDVALDEARRAEAALRVARPLHPYGLAMLANALRARGEPEQALDCARRGIAIVDELGSVSEIEVDAQVAYLEALLGMGEREQARTELRRFKRRFDQRVAGIADPALRACFCTGVPANVRLLELCGEFGAGGIVH
jgi:eukaryotic-like serine/threonine-protein kinase